MGAIFPIIIELVKQAPSLVQTGQQVVDGARQLWDTVSSEQAPTPELQAEYDRALQEAHDALQRS